MDNHTPQPATLRPADAAAYLGVSRPTLYRWLASGQFPKPKRLGPNSVAWLRTDIEDWLAGRPAHDAPATGPREAA